MDAPAQADVYEDELTLTPHPAWAQRFWDDLVPLKDRVARHPVFTGMADATLSPDAFRFTLTHFYPLVENFPKFMGLTLSRCRPGRPGHEAARNWLMGNMRVEERHAAWFRDWVGGLGVSRAELEAERPPAAMDAVNYYLWYMCANASLAEAIGACNLAIEWATGEWCQQAVKGMRTYAQRGEMDVNRRTMAWLRAHAHYDDAHPHEAMELIKRLAQTDEERRDAYRATERGLEYYLLALEQCRRPMLVD